MSVLDPAATGGIDMDSDLISELAEHDNICGVKLTYDMMSCRIEGNLNFE